MKNYYTEIFQEGNMKVKIYPSVLRVIAFLVISNLTYAQWPKKIIDGNPEGNYGIYVEDIDGDNEQ